jgi:hypothetical protein
MVRIKANAGPTRAGWKASYKIVFDTDHACLQAGHQSQDSKKGLEEGSKLAAF